MEFKRKRPEIVHMGRVREEGEMDKIELAILANGGEKHLKNWCQCDADVGAVLCEYCAIYNGLMYARELLRRVEELDLALQSLTPGGSEFVHDSIRCVAYVQDVIKTQLEQIKRFALRSKEVEKRVEELEDALFITSGALEGARKRIEELENILEDERVLLGEMVGQGKGAERGPDWEEEIR